MTRSRILATVAAVTALAAGAGAGPLKKPKPAQTGTLDANGVYQLSAEEKSYDCKKLTGIMRIRILELQASNSGNRSTMLSRGMQTLAEPIWGGTDRGKTPDAAFAKDRAMLVAFNRRLAEKKCPTLDLETELKPAGAKAQ